MNGSLHKREKKQKIIGEIQVQAFNQLDSVE